MMMSQMISLLALVFYFCFLSSTLYFPLNFDRIQFSIINKLLAVEQLAVVTKVSSWKASKGSVKV